MNVWDTEDCQGAPSAYFSWLQGGSMTDNPASFVSFLKIQTSVCGSGVSPFVAQSECCITSLVPRDTIYKSSSFAIKPPGSSLESHFPASGRGYNYCSLDSFTANSKGINLFKSYTALLIKEGSSYGTLSCLKNGTLKINSNSGSSEVYQLNESTISLNSPIIGLASARFYNVDRGDGVMKWITYSPYELMKPVFQKKWEIIAMLCCVVAYVCLLATILFFTVRYAKFRNEVYRLYAVNQVLFLFGFIIQTYQTYGSGINEIFVSFGWAIQAFSTLFSVLHSAKLLTDLMEQNEKVNRAIYSSLLGIHVFLCGAYYTRYWAGYFVSIWNAWATIFVYWLVFALLFLMAPVGFLIYKMVLKNAVRVQNNDTPMHRLLLLFQKDLLFTGLIVGNLAAIFSYFGLRIFDIYFSAYYGDLRTQISFINIRYVFLVLSFGFHCFLLDHVAVIIQNRSTFRNHALPLAEARGKGFVAIGGKVIKSSANANDFSERAGLISDENF